jgi:hypothetical protein
MLCCLWLIRFGLKALIDNGWEATGVEIGKRMELAGVV